MTQESIECIECNTRTLLDPGKPGKKTLLVMFRKHNVFVPRGLSGFSVAFYSLLTVLAEPLAGPWMVSERRPMKSSTRIRRGFWMLDEAWRGTLLVGAVHFLCSTYMPSP